MSIDLMFDWFAVFALGLIAWHGLTYRDANGSQPFVHLLFGCIALLYCFKFLFSEILGVW